MTTTRLADRLTDVYSNEYFSFGFQNAMEYHIPIIKGLSTTQLLALNPGVSLKYDGDLFGLLYASNVPSKYHWVTMRCNGMLSPTDYRKSNTEITIPDFDYIDEQFAIYRTSNNIQIG